MKVGNTTIKLAYSAWILKISRTIVMWVGIAVMVVLAFPMALVHGIWAGVKASWNMPERIG